MGCGNSKTTSAHPSPHQSSRSLRSPEHFETPVEDISGQNRAETVPEPHPNGQIVNTSEPESKEESGPVEHTTVDKFSYTENDSVPDCKNVKESNSHQVEADKASKARPSSTVSSVDSVAVQALVNHTIKEAAADVSSNQRKGVPGHVRPSSTASSVDSVAVRTLVDETINKAAAGLRDNPGLTVKEDERGKGDGILNEKPVETTAQSGSTDIKEEEPCVSSNVVDTLSTIKSEDLSSQTNDEPSEDIGGQALTNSDDPQVEDNADTKQEQQPADPSTGKEHMNNNINNDSEDQVIPEPGSIANADEADHEEGNHDDTVPESNTEKTSSDINENTTPMDSNVCENIVPEMEKDDQTQQDTGPESGNAQHEEVVTTPTDVKESTTPPESNVCESSAPHTTKQLDPKAQETFDHALRAFCPLVDPKQILDLISPGIGTLRLDSAPLPADESFTQLLAKLTDIEVLDFDKNEMGPQAFRVLMLALSANTSIKSVVLSNNKTDTDTAESVGMMLMMNQTLTSLDLSSNQLGKDYLSRCIGPAFKTNRSLTSLNISSCGATDLDVLVAGLQENTTLTSLDISHNQLSNSVSFIASLCEVLKNSSCAIRELNVRNCGIQGTGLQVLGSGIKDNTSLTTLSTGGNSVDDIKIFMDFLMACLQHTALETLNVNDTRVSDTATTNLDLPAITDRKESHLVKLNIANCSLTDDIISRLANHLPGCLPRLSEFGLSGNTEMTTASLQAVAKLTAQNEGAASAVTSLHLDQLSLEDLPQHLLNNPSFPCLEGLSICKARITPASVGKLCDLVQCPNGLTELCLSGLKLSETGALAQLLQPGNNLKLKSLSLAGCALKDDDLEPLTSALTAGWPVTSLTLANNRLTSSGINPLLEAMVATDEPLVESLNLNSNQLSDDCKDALTSLVSRAKKLHTLSLNRNELGCDTISSILESLQLAERLKLLDLRNQSSPVDEDDMEDLMKKLASQLGYTVHMDEYGGVEAKRSPLPSRQCDLTILLTGLGCDLGPVGRSLDSAMVKTDHRMKHPLPVSLQHALHLGAWMTSQDLTSQPELSESSWEAIVGIKKDPSIPSWLKVEKLRDCAVYISNLSSNVSASKLEGDLDAEADCNVREVCIMKDPIQRKPNGYAWVLMADEESVKRAMDFYYSGQALMFSQPYIISPVSLKIPDFTTDENAEDLVSEEMARRERERVTEAAEHQQLLETSFAASRARHEYAKAHPAYADGRIF